MYTSPCDPFRFFEFYNTIPAISKFSLCYGKVCEHGNVYPF